MLPSNPDRETDAAPGTATKADTNTDADTDTASDTDTQAEPTGDGPRTWRVLGSIGPLFSNGGLANWELILGEEQLVARPLGLGPSLKAGVLAGISGGLGVDLPGNPYARPSEWDRARLIEDPGDASWRRYPVAELAFIEVRRCFFSNEVRLQRRGQREQIYGLGDCSQTDGVRALLRACYPDLYCEDNFERRWYSFLYR